MALNKRLPHKKGTRTVHAVTAKKTSATNDEVVEMLQFIIERMVTKEELKEVLDERLDELKSDLVREIRSVDKASRDRDEQLAEKIDGIYDELDGIKSRTKRLEDVVFR